LEFVIWNLSFFLMLSQKYRLPTSFFRTRVRPLVSFISGCVSVRVYKATHPLFRCAVVVPIKTAGIAVQRNLLRRTAYDVVRTCIEKLPICDVVFFLSQPNCTHVQEDMTRACAQLTEMNVQ